MASISDRGRGPRPSPSPLTEEGAGGGQPATQDIGRLLAVGRKRLEDARADAPWLTALALLEHATALDRAALLAHPESRPRPDAADTYRRLLERRCRREPLAYVLGHRDFWGRRFEVSPATLIPRPETERIVEMALEWLEGPGRLAAGLDVGTGCGNLAISLLAERPDLAMVATDLDVGALQVARRNAERHGVADRLRLVASHLASAVSDPFALVQRGRSRSPVFRRAVRSIGPPRPSLRPPQAAGDKPPPYRTRSRRPLTRDVRRGVLVVANLPYIPTSRIAALEPEIARFEPRRALDGGPDGMRVVTSLLVALPALLAPGGLALVEIGDDQSEELTAVARRQSRTFAVRIEPDATGAKRFLAITNREP